MSNPKPSGDKVIVWIFTVDAGFPAIVEFNLSNVAPLSGFYLEHNDPDSAASVYFSSELEIVPVPSAVVLGAIGIGLAGWIKRRSL